MDAIVSKTPLITIDGRDVGPGHPAFIIAEVGVNHNGDLTTAHRMVDAIADAGCDCVKFQTFSADEFCNDPDDMYEYVSQGEVVRESMLEMFRRFELKRGEFAELFDHAHERNMIAMSTPTDKAAVELLETLGVGAYKVGSDDLVYTPFLQYVTDKGKPVIISTGMAEMADVERAVATIEAQGTEGQAVILHCISQYPTPENAVNLRRIETLRARFPQCVVGYSDHSWGITSALGAVALGAAVVEKHFTLDNDMPGPDHRFSANPQQLTDMVREIRKLEASMGSGVIEKSAADQEMADLCHRSIYAAQDLAVGHVLSEDDFVYQRPGTGLMPYHTADLVGKRLCVGVEKGAAMRLDMVKE